MLQVVLIIAIVLVCLFTISALRIREIAIAATRRHLKTLDLQLLDQSVSLSKIRVAYNQPRQEATFGLLRIYRFAFTSTGDERYHGEVKMINARLLDISLEPHRLPDNFE